MFINTHLLLVLIWASLAAVVLAATENSSTINMTEVEALRRDVEELKSDLRFLSDASRTRYETLTKTISEVQRESFERSNILNGPRFFTEWKEIEENETLLVKHFTFDSRQFLGVVQSQGLSIYEFNSTTLSILQTIPLTGTTSFTYYTIDNKHYVAISSSLVYSRVYEWDGANSRFYEMQQLDTEGATDVEFIAIFNSGKFLVFSCSGAPSLVYHWVFGSFLYYQSLATSKAMRVNLMVTQSSRETFIAFAESDNVPSHIYRWNLTYFDFYQSVELHSVHEMYPYTVGQHTFLVAANEQSTLAFIHSTAKRRFVEFAPLAVTQAPLSVSYFNADSEHFVVAARESHCDVYRMVGARFELFQTIPVQGGASYVHNFSLSESGECLVLAVVSRFGGITLYHWTNISSNGHCSL